MDRPLVENRGLGRPLRLVVEGALIGAKIHRTKAPDETVVSLVEPLPCFTDVFLGASVHPVSKPKAHYLVATDAHHLYASNSFAFELKTSLTIPSSRFLLWPEFSTDGDWLASVRPAHAKESGYAQINFNRWRFITKLIDEPFPNWRNVVPEEHRPV